MRSRSLVLLGVSGLCLAPLLGACGNDRSDHREPPHDVERARRVIEPPVGIVRPLPPFLISSVGVGPYRLGDRLADILQQLPTGPRIAMFEIPGVLHRSLIRAEEGDSIRVGGEPNGTATSVTVIDGNVARTEGGLHVGSTRAELAKAGLEPDELARAHDPRLAIAASPHGARVLFDPDRRKDRIAAIVVTTDAPVAAPAPEGPACPRPPDTDFAFGACMTGSGEYVEVDGNEITIHGAEERRTRSAAGKVDDKPLAPPLRIPATVVFAAPLRIEGRDELVIITRSDEPQLRTWSLITYRFEGPKLVKTADTPLYELSTANARWIGVELPEIDLYLELAAGADSIEVGGLLTTAPEQPRTQEGPWRDVVVISPVSVARRHDKPTRPAAPATGGSGSVDVPVDASTGVVDAAASANP